MRRQFPHPIAADLHSRAILRKVAGGLRDGLRAQLEARQADLWRRLLDHPGDRAALRELNGVRERLAQLRDRDDGPEA